MNLRDSLRDHARNRGHPTRFPGERRTTSGLFSGLDGRLVHVGEGGQLRDFSAPLTGRVGLGTSRFGVRVDGDVRWLDGFADAGQRYHDDTALVESTYRDGDVVVDRLDLALGDDHLTHVDASGPADALVVSCSFRPEGREARIGKLVYADRGVLEAHHRREHDFLASATGFDAVEGSRPPDAGALLDDDPPRRPDAVEDDAYEADRLGGDVVVVAPLVHGRTTVATSLRSDVEDRDAAVESMRRRVREFDAAGLRAAAEVQTPDVAGDAQSSDVARDAQGPDVAGDAQASDVPGDAQGRDVPADAVADLRVLSLLSAPSGARVAGPDFDPLYANSGGYGYTWFRDDAEIARHLLAADGERDLGLGDWHDRSARFYLDAQLEDGSWPHRVWPSDGSLAPGWANARVEGDGDDYQADQTASVVAFLADYYRLQRAADEEDSGGATAGRPPDAPAVESALAAGVAALDESLAADGLPEACQNAWEDMTGRFTHTAATYLSAYASVANAPVGDLAAHASEQARAVLDGLDALWCPDRGTYALRLDDERLDASTFALVDAVRTAVDAGIDVDDDAIGRLASHVATTLDGLARETDAVSGLVRYEGDDWRAREQDDPKIWTVSTAWGAHAASELAVLLEHVEGDDSDGEATTEWTAAAFDSRAEDLLSELAPGGSLCQAGGYLPEQVFDDGTPDSATPLGWPHAIRLATVARRDATNDPVPVPEDD